MNSRCKSLSQTLSWIVSYNMSFLFFLSQETERIAKIYTIGCIDAFKYWVSQNLVIVAIAAGIVLLVEVSVDMTRV